jgi:predicted transcriptional regulator
MRGKEKIMGPVKVCCVRDDFWRVLVFKQELSHNTRRVLLQFLVNIQSDGSSGVCLTEIARASNMKIQAASRSASYLVSKGYMKKLGKEGKVVRFGFDPQQVFPAFPEEVERVTVSLDRMNTQKKIPYGFSVFIFADERDDGSGLFAINFGEFPSKFMGFGVFFRDRVV